MQANAAIVMEPVTSKYKANDIVEVHEAVDEVVVAAGVCETIVPNEVSRGTENGSSINAGKDYSHSVLPVVLSTDMLVIQIMSAELQL